MSSLSLYLRQRPSFRRSRLLLCKGAYGKAYKTCVTLTFSTASMHTWWCAGLGSHAPAVGRSRLADASDMFRSSRPYKIDRPVGVHPASLQGYILPGTDSRFLPTLRKCCCTRCTEPAGAAALVTLRTKTTHRGLLARFVRLPHSGTLRVLRESRCGWVVTQQGIHGSHFGVSIYATGLVPGCARCGWC